MPAIWATSKYVFEVLLKHFVDAVGTRLYLLKLLENRDKEFEHKAMLFLILWKWELYHKLHIFLTL